MRDLLLSSRFEGWCTVEQDDPTLNPDSLGDASKTVKHLNASDLSKNTEDDKIKWGMIGGGEGSQI